MKEGLSFRSLETQSDEFGVAVVFILDVSEVIRYRSLVGNSVRLELTSKVRALEALSCSGGSRILGNSFHKVVKRKDLAILPRSDLKGGWAGEVIAVVIEA